MGVFANAQPEYAAHGIATFPVNPDKRPAIRNYGNIGLRGSSALAVRMPDAPCVGFIAGPRSGITVLDIDTACERVFADALDRHGRTPVIVRTASGHLHAWYRHSGEKRAVRPHPDRPIDVLGAGMVIAPPSQAAKGTYGFLEGSLDDLAALPVMRGFQAVSEGSRRLAKGQGRNEALFRHLMHQAPYCDSMEALLDVARIYAEEHFADPMSDRELVRTVRSVWRYESANMNWVGRKRPIASMTGLAGLARQDSDALALFIILREAHGAREEFALARAMCVELGWTLARWRSARDRLRAEGLIICTHEGGRGPKDPPRYRFG